MNERECTDPSWGGYQEPIIDKKVLKSRNDENTYMSMYLSCLDLKSELKDLKQRYKELGALYGQVDESLKEKRREINDLKMKLEMAEKSASEHIAATVKEYQLRQEAYADYNRCREYADELEREKERLLNGVADWKKECFAIRAREEYLQKDAHEQQNRYDELLRKYNDLYTKWGLDPRGQIEDIQKKVDKILIHVEPCPDDDYFETYSNDEKR